MIVIRRNAERRQILSGKSTMWLSFFPRDTEEPSGEGFGAVRVFNEYALAAIDGRVTEAVGDAGLVTYVYKGALAIEGPKGYSGIITAGEFQCMTIICPDRQDLTNATGADLTHFFRIYFGIPPSRNAVDGAVEQLRFTTAIRRNVLCMVASPDTPEKSLRITADARIYSGIFDPGRHLVHELLHGRKAWLHVVSGSVTVNDVDLARGDGMGIVDEPSVSFTAGENTELILVDTP